MTERKTTPSLSPAVRARHGTSPSDRRTGLAVSSLPEYLFNANGVCSCQPGATSQETGPQNSASAESAFQGDGELIPHFPFGELDESRFQRFRCRIDFPGATPQAEIKAAPLALNTYRAEEDMGPNGWRNGPAFVPQPRDYGLARAGKPAEKAK